MRPARLVILLTLLAGISPVRAHSAGELTMTATVRPKQLDLVVTMAASTAARLLDPTAEALPHITTENFPANRDRLIAAATAHFFSLTTAATARPLALRSVSVALTPENDLEFVLLYPRPMSGPLRIRATVLALLGPGHGGILEASDTAGHHLGWEQLSPEQPVVTLTVPAP